MNFAAHDDVVLGGRITLDEPERIASLVDLGVIHFAEDSVRTGVTHKPLELLAHDLYHIGIVWRLSVDLREDGQPHDQHTDLRDCAHDQHGNDGPDGLGPVAHDGTGLCLAAAILHDEVPEDDAAQEEQGTGSSQEVSDHPVNAVPVGTLDLGKPTDSKTANDDDSEQEEDDPEAGRSGVRGGLAHGFYSSEKENSMV